MIWRWFGWLGKNKLVERTDLMNVKEAVSSAMAAYSGFYPERQIGATLEEVQLSDDGKNWLVTIGYPLPATMALITSGADLKDYKTVVIDAQTGQFIALKIRKP